MLKFLEYVCHECGKKDRPKIHLQESEHQLVKDFHQGITQERAMEIAQYALHPKD